MEMLSRMLETAVEASLYYNVHFSMLCSSLPMSYLSLSLGFSLKAIAIWHYVCKQYIRPIPCQGPSPILGVQAKQVTCIASLVTVV